MISELTSESKQQKPTTFLNYIHYFRGVAIIFVVAGHLLLIWPADSTVYLFFRTFWENGTVLFVFIAGYLFQHLSKKFEYKNYLRKKMENVLLPYFIVSIPILAYRLMTNDTPALTLDLHPDFRSWSILSKLGYYLIRGAHMQQIWFIPMIALFYITAPILIYIDRNSKLYYLLIGFISLSLFVERFPQTNIIKMFVHFFSVYLFGMFMSRYREQYLFFAQKYWIIITTSTVVTLLLNLYFYKEYNNQLNYLHKMLFCCFFIYWLWKLNRFVPKIMSTLAEVSFGIFFIHYYVILFFRALYTKAFGHALPGNIFYWTLDLIIVLAISIFIIRIIQKILPRYSRYIIGC